MSTDLQRRLQMLEEDYFNQPRLAQRADLQEINQIRSQLGMPLVDERLKEIVAVIEEKAEPSVQPEPVAAPDHSEARQIYQAYLKKAADLERHRAYAEKVAKATANPGQTPVRPLATMGTNGGPLLCDQCGKPIVLEGGGFHGVTADVAWKKNPQDDWVSWILGGMVVEIETNGTLRIYHGYPGRDGNQCCNVASREDAKARAAFQSGQRFEKEGPMHAFLEHEFPNKAPEERQKLLEEILDTMYNYDPGWGVNRPT